MALRVRASHLNEGSYQFLGGSSLRHFTTLTSIVTMDILKVQMFLFCHVNSPDHTFKELYVTLRVETFHGKLLPCQVCGYWLCTSGDIKYLICHKTSRNHVIEGSCNCMCGNSSFVRHHRGGQVR